MTGSFRLRIGIISVVIGGHFGGGDHLDGWDHFGGGTGLEVRISSGYYEHDPKLFS